MNSNASFTLPAWRQQRGWPVWFPSTAHGTTWFTWLRPQTAGLPFSQWSWAEVETLIYWLLVSSQYGELSPAIATVLTDILTFQSYSLPHTPNVSWASSSMSLWKGDSGPQKEGGLPAIGRGATVRACLFHRCLGSSREVERLGPSPVHSPCSARLQGHPDWLQQAVLPPTHTAALRKPVFPTNFKESI